VDAEELEAAFVMLFDGKQSAADRILVCLRSQFADLPREDVADFFQEACVEVVARQRAGKDTSNVPGLVTTIARNKLQDARKARYAAEAGHELLVIQAQLSWQHDDERQARIERGTKYVRGLVAAWDSDNHRRTMTLLLDAAVEGMLLTPKEIDERLGCARGTGGVWKQRCFDRLRADLAREGLEWDEVLDVLPIDDDDPNETDDDEEFES